MIHYPRDKTAIWFEVRSFLSRGYFLKSGHLAIPAKLHGPKGDRINESLLYLELIFHNKKKVHDYIHYCKKKKCVCVLPQFKSTSAKSITPSLPLSCFHAFWCFPGQILAIACRYNRIEKHLRSETLLGLAGGNTKKRGNKKSGESILQSVTTSFTCHYFASSFQRWFSKANPSRVMFNSLHTVHALWGTIMIIDFILCKYNECWWFPLIQGTYTVQPRTVIVVDGSW